MDIKLNYIEQGEGYPLILLHGNGEDCTKFQAQLDYFQKWYHVIAIDTRGHGASPRGTAPFTYEQFAEDLEDFMDEHGIFTADILGFSDGGIIALLFALNNPTRVNKLVLNGTNLSFDGVESEYREKILAELASAEAAKDESEEAYSHYECMKLMVEQKAIDPARLNTLEVPTLVIVGTSDMINGEHTQLIYKSLPKAEMQIMIGSHFLVYESPKEFNHAVGRFLHKMV